MVKKKLILVFGASSGVGKELSKLLSRKYKIIAFYNKNKPKFDKKIQMKNLNFLKENEVKKIPKIINLNNFKIVILNFASIKIDKMSLFVNKVDFNKTVQINIHSYFKIIQTILPVMMKNSWGRIINISSTGGAAGEKGTMLYSMSKNATHGIMQVMSKEYGKFNITFNTLKLGNFNYGLYKKLNKNIQKKILEKIPSNKTGDIKNIFFAVEFLMNSDYVNGSSINIDGGYR